LARDRLEQQQFQNLMVLERIQPLGQKPRPQPLPMTLMQRFHP